jgi:hypothetical protein
MCCWHCMGLWYRRLNTSVAPSSSSLCCSGRSSGRSAVGADGWIWTGLLPCILLGGCLLGPAAVVFTVVVDAGGERNADDGLHSVLSGVSLLLAPLFHDDRGEGSTACCSSCTASHALQRERELGSLRTAGMCKTGNE